MDGKSLCGATKQAMQVVSNMIEMNYENVDKYQIRKKELQYLPVPMWIH